MAWLGLVLTACVPAEDEDPDESPQPYTCSAVINAGPIDYVIFGDSLTISSGGTSEVLTRAVDPEQALPVYGSWQVTDARNTATLTLTVSEDRVSLITECRLGGKTGRAGVSSAADVSEDRIMVLASDRDDVKF